jgi:hypothetical protein
VLNRNIINGIPESYGEDHKMRAINENVSVSIAFWTFVEKF